MSSKSKQKGNRFERECVDTAKDKGIKSIRAWGSDGRSLGLAAVKENYGEVYVIQRYEEWLEMVNTLRQQS